ncbi:uncharacterized protein TNCV_3461161 [Trichonephila clavipes]|nr:uncharacterized protein TNCV_3461161 [Trichonephila clavipes]
MDLVTFILCKHAHEMPNECMASGSGAQDQEEFGVTVAELRDLMEVRGYEACQRIQDEHSGVHNLCRKLHTSPTDGQYPITLDIFRNALMDSAQRLSFLN